jgi:hypothetical protein
MGDWVFAHDDKAKTVKCTESRRRKIDTYSEPMAKGQGRKDRQA